MNRGQTGDFYLYRRSTEFANVEACGGTIECFLATLIDSSLAILALAFLIVMALATLLFVPRARTLCETEGERVRTEYGALDEFIQRVKQISPATTTATTAGAGTVSNYAISQGMTELSAVTDAYRETVMAVPHYEVEYNETLAEHMRAEFGEDIAHGVLSSDRLTQPVKRGVIHAAIAARDRRKSLQQILDHEQRSISYHGKRLESIEGEVSEMTEPLCADQSYDELIERRHSLEASRETINEICIDRQKDRCEGQIGALARQDDFDLQDYLYDQLDVTYPILADATRLYSRIDTVVGRIEDELIYRA